MLAESVPLIDGQPTIDPALELHRGIAPDRLAAVQADFTARGETVADWSKRHGFKRHTVYKVLRGERRCLRGEQHKIAIALGLKDDPTGGDGNV